jgi:hypothetical protein
MPATTRLSTSAIPRTSHAAPERHRRDRSNPEGSNSQNRQRTTSSSIDAAHLPPHTKLTWADRVRIGVQSNDSRHGSPAKTGADNNLHHYDIKEEDSESAEDVPLDFNHFQRSSSAASNSFEEFEEEEELSTPQPNFTQFERQEETGSPIREGSTEEDDEVSEESTIQEPEDNHRFNFRSHNYRDSAERLLNDGSGVTIQRFSKFFFQHPEQLLNYSRKSFTSVVVRLNLPGWQTNVVMEAFRMLSQEEPMPAAPEPPRVPEVHNPLRAAFDILPGYVQAFLGGMESLQGLKNPVNLARLALPLARCVGGEFDFVRCWLNGSFDIRDDNIKRMLDNALPPELKRLPFWIYPKCVTLCLQFDYMMHLNASDGATSFLGAHLQLFHAASRDLSMNIVPIVTMSQLAKALENWAAFYDCLHNHFRVIMRLDTYCYFLRLVEPWVERLRDSSSQYSWRNLSVNSLVNKVSDRIVKLVPHFKAIPDFDSLTQADFFYSVLSDFSKGVSDDLTILTELSLISYSEPQYTYYPRRRDDGHRPALQLAPKAGKPGHFGGPITGRPAIGGQRRPQPNGPKPPGICVMDLAHRWLGHGQGCKYPERNQGRHCPHEHLASVPAHGAAWNLDEGTLAKLRESLTHLNPANAARRAIEAKLG